VEEVKLHASGGEHYLKRAAGIATDRRGNPRHKGRIGGHGTAHHELRCRSTERGCPHPTCVTRRQWALRCPELSLGGGRRPELTTSEDLSPCRNLSLQRLRGSRCTLDCGTVGRADGLERQPSKRPPASAFKEGDGRDDEIRILRRLLNNLLSRRRWTSPWRAVWRALLQPKRITETDGVIASISIQIDPARQPDGILRQEGSMPRP